MQLIKKLLCILLISGIYFSSFAQAGKDLLITNNGDTLRGSLKPVENYSRSVSFRGLEQDDYANFNASDISLALRGTDAFKSVIISAIAEERIFLRVLALGQISLYKGGNRYYLEKNGVVVTLTKKDTVINNVQKIDRSYMGMLNALMRDRDIPVEKINATSFNDTDLSKLVMRYNGDKGNKTPSKSFTPNEQPVVTAGVKGGSYSSRFKYAKGEYSGFTFDPHSGSLFDIYATIRVADKLFIQPELYFVTKGGAYSHEFENSRQEAMNFDYLIKSSHLSLNVRYNILPGRFTPYVLGGFSFALSISPEKIYRQEVYEDYTIALPKIDLTSEIGYRGGIGVNYKLFQAWQISVETLLEHTRIHTDDDDFYSDGLGLLAGIGYTFSAK